MSSVYLGSRGDVPISLDPGMGPYEILMLDLEGSFEGPEACATCALSFSPRVCVSDLPPYPWIDTGAGWSYVEYALRAFDVCPPAFRRGDANASGKVDISDAIRIFMTLFQGAAPFPCDDAADANDDGSVNISDGLRILLDFFIPGTSIPDPGPFTCGPDPTRDELSCRSPSTCG